MEKIPVVFKGKVVTLTIEEIGENLDLDELTRIDYSNLYGEYVTVSALLNRVGILRASLQERESGAKLKREVYAAEFRRSKRKEAAQNSGKVNWDGEQVKLTEKILDDMLILDPEYMKRAKIRVAAKKNFEVLDGLFKSISSKDKKLSILLKGVSPEEFTKEIVEKRVNGIMIRKAKNIFN